MIPEPVTTTAHVCLEWDRNADAAVEGAAAVLREKQSLKKTPKKTCIDY